MPGDTVTNLSAGGGSPGSASGPRGRSGPGRPGNWTPCNFPFPIEAGRMWRAYFYPGLRRGNLKIILYLQAERNPRLVFFRFLPTRSEFLRSQRPRAGWLLAENVHWTFSFRSAPVRDVVQPGRIHAWGACGRWFESSHPDEANPDGESVGVLYFKAPRRARFPKGREIQNRAAQSAVGVCFSSPHLWITRVPASVIQPPGLPDCRSKTIKRFMDKACRGGIKWRYY